MGRTRIPGLYWDATYGRWAVDKVINGARIRRDFAQDFGEAESWLLGRIEEGRQQRLNPKAHARTFAEAAAHYVEDMAEKASLETDIAMLKSLMPYIGEVPIDELSDDHFKPYINDRREAGRKKKTINLGLASARQVLNACNRKYRDGRAPWLAIVPIISMLALDDQRPPYQLSWPQQRTLMPKLPDHLARMALFTLNSGARDDVVCSLRWDWEVRIPDTDRSVFVVPRVHVKGRRQERVLVLNRVAQSVIESARGMHPEYVFVYRRINRKTGITSICRPIETMNNTSWQRARKQAGLPDLHVHDMRHTVGMRLREAGVGEETRADLLWHKREGMPAHYSVAQIVELQNAIELVADEQNCSNRTLASIVQEARTARTALTESPEKSPRMKTG